MIFVIFTNFMRTEKYWGVYVVYRLESFPFLNFHWKKKGKIKLFQQRYEYKQSDHTVRDHNQDCYLLNSG